MIKKAPAVAKMDKYKIVNQIIGPRLYQEVLVMAFTSKRIIIRALEIIIFVV